MPSPLLSLFKSHISITHLQTHHAKKLAIYQACIIQPQLETFMGRGGEWARLTKKSNSKHKQLKTQMKKPQSKVQTQGKISNLPLEQKLLERAINISFHTIQGPQPISKLGLVVRLTASFSIMLRPFPFHSFELKLYQVMMLEPMSDHLRQK